ncbi:Chloride channel protein 1 (ClC-1) (Chloride channel protein [Durusdinium trenchii]|uniref:Skeletal muscle n=1 Tax=Durusdinium trenchii TaxID=1381693 RepID=A0ABP0JD84_9DINO
MTCFGDLGVLLGLSILWSRVEASWRRKRQKRLDLLQDLARRVLGRELVSGGGPESYENTVAESVLRAVRQYQDQRPRSERCAPPTFGECCAVTPGLSAVRSLSSSAGGLLSPMLQHAGLVKDEVDVDPEDLLCEDVRCWLSSTSRGELERHLGFYRQVLMRPEVFAEDPRFFHLLVFLCERLEELLGRLSVTSRDCATQLAKVISIGKELLDGLLPVLLLSICDLLDGPTPLLSIETLLSSIEAERLHRVPRTGSQNGNILRAKMDGAQKIQNSLHWEVDNYNGEKGVQSTSGFHPHRYTCEALDAHEPPGGGDHEHGIGLWRPAGGARHHGGGGERLRRAEGVAAEPEGTAPRGHRLDGSFRVLVAKVVALALGVSAGLPLGQEGPHVHIAACFARILNPGFFDRCVHQTPHGAGGSGYGAAVAKLLLAACATGFSGTFSAPVGGVIFSLELMLPQTYDYDAYRGCLTASVIGAMIFAMERNVWQSGRPLVTSNVLPGEGDITEFPLLTLLTVSLGLGILCGLAGGIWVRSHSWVASTLRRLVLRSAQSRPRLKTVATPLLRFPRDFSTPMQQRSWDLVLIAMLALTNTLLASCFPLLGGRAQPLLLSSIFDKNLLNSDDWVLPWAGVSGTFGLCFLTKWTMTLWALSSEIPAGIVAPSLVIGGLLGRIYAHVLLPEWFLDMLLATDNATPSELQKGAFMARCAIFGASAFCCAVCRAVGMAIAVFEVLLLPNSVLPLSCSALVAVFVANQISLSFFDATLADENLAGIPAISFSDKALDPIMKVMEEIDLKHCLPQVLTLQHLLKEVRRAPEALVPIIRPLDWTKSHEALLMGTITEGQAFRLLRRVDPQGVHAELEVDLLDPQFLAPSDGSEPFVDGCPLRISPENTVKDAYLLMKMAESGVIYVTHRGMLKGTVTMATLLCRDP